ncbi:MAG: hypothetical protein ABFD84_16875 [Candidatus Polarisedimenticolia bacterium]|nr:hypothetical protein [bacterium]
MIHRLDARRSTIVEPAAMLDRQPETGRATPEYVVVPPPAAPEPVPFEDVPGWSGGEQVERHHCSAKSGSSDEARAAVDRGRRGGAALLTAVDRSRGAICRPAPSS